MQVKRTQRYMVTHHYKDRDERLGPQLELQLARYRQPLRSIGASLSASEHDRQ